MVALHQLVNVVCPLPPLKNLWAKENMRPCSSVREIMRSLFRSSWRQQVPLKTSDDCVRTPRGYIKEVVVFCRHSWSLSACLMMEEFIQGYTFCNSILLEGCSEYVQSGSLVYMYSSTSASARALFQLYYSSKKQLSLPSPGRLGWRLYRERPWKVSTVS